MDILTAVMAFIYTIGHLIAEKIVLVIQTISGVKMPLEIVDTIGLLIILTIALIAAEVAKKIVWIIVIIGWVLIILRIVLLVIA